LQQRTDEIVRRHVRIGGVVQGVGFRPYVYRLAVEESLVGKISNGTSGVTLEVEGIHSQVEQFLKRLPAELPPLARITSFVVSELEVSGDSKFVIVASDASGHVNTQIPADAATCSDCLRELLDPKDRRYRYPFINCTNCGPRFTITRKIPYDRPQTSMAQFPMCSVCEAEYHDPLNRRFHAQPNACWECGPRVWLTDVDGWRRDVVDPVAEAIRHLTEGCILAIKGIGGFHLAVDATNEEAVKRLRERKHRYGKPLAVMVRDLETAHTLCEISEAEAKLLTGPEHPIVLVRRNSGDDSIVASVAPHIPWLGVFLPYAPLQHLLFADGRLKALVMTSANLTEEPIVIENNEALSRLKTIADGFLFHNRDILQRCDDSVMAVVERAPQIIRHARGFVPLPLELPFEAPPLLAVGGHLKNVFTLASGQFAYQSQHLGDLDGLLGLKFFEEALAHLKHVFEVEPKYLVHDLHPGYLSTQWAVQQQTLPRLGVQHHHAHIASCIAEYRLEGPVIGVSLDGTGYGTDGHVWGGEVLIATLKDFERFAHLKYVAMPGSEAAIRQPWRMAFVHLHSFMGSAVHAPEILALLGTTARDAQILDRMILRNINSPLTSSCGRLFDAAAALILGRREVSYEAQAAIELEGVAPEIGEGPLSDGYPIRFNPGIWTHEHHEPAEIDPAPMWEQLLADLRRGEDLATMSLRFHVAIAVAYAQCVASAGVATGIRQVALSGGVFHNRLLTRVLCQKVQEAGLKVYLQSRVNPGDGGLSYGQAAVAAARLIL
jgi:hydrogenase maturation protein HypF